MRQHRGQHMMMPARILAHFIVGHAQFGFAFFEALFYRPADATEPDKGPQGRAHWGITHRGGVGGLRPLRPLDDQPDRAIREPYTQLGGADAPNAQELLGFFSRAVLARFRGSIDTRNQSRDCAPGNPLETEPCRLR